MVQKWRKWNTCHCVLLETPEKGVVTFSAYKRHLLRPGAVLAEQYSAPLERFPLCEQTCISCGQVLFCWFRLKWVLHRVLLALWLESQDTIELFTYPRFTSRWQWMSLCCLRHVLVLEFQTVQEDNTRITTKNKSQNNQTNKTSAVPGEVVQQHWLAGCSYRFISSIYLVAPNHLQFWFQGNKYPLLSQWVLGTQVVHGTHAGETSITHFKLLS